MFHEWNIDGSKTSGINQAFCKRDTKQDLTQKREKNESENENVIESI